jgi:hypothetical protein
MRTTHTSCRKGTTVLITLRGGQKWVDKFKDKKGRYIILEEFGRLPIGELRAMSIYKGQTR